MAANEMIISDDSNVKSNALMPNLNSWILQTQLLGLGLQTYGTYIESQVQAETLEYNAVIAERDVGIVEKYKKHELHKVRTEQRKLLAKQIAATAASGRSFSGSPLAVMARSQSEAQTDMDIVRSNAARSKGRLYGQAIFDRGSAETIEKTGKARAFSNLLVSGSNIYAKSNYFKKRGK